MNQQYIKLCAAAVSAALSYLFGGLDMLLFVLLVLMGMDYLTGVLCGIAKRELSSRIGFRESSKRCAFCALSR